MATNMLTSMPPGSLLARHWQLPEQKPWESKLQGYAQQVLVQQPVPSEFLCGFCELVLRQPMQNSCGHRFCLVCVVGKKEVPCPLCEKEPDEALIMDSSVSDVSVRPDMAQWRMMLKRPAQCPNCDWKGSFEQFESSHYAECRMHKIPCSDCGVLLLIAEVDDHRANNCPKRAVPCPKCGELSCADELALHLEDQCPKGLVKCDSCPAPPMAREQLEDHYKRTCPVPKIPCPYGCVFLFIEPSKLEAHEMECLYRHVQEENKKITEKERLHGSGDSQAEDDGAAQAQVTQLKTKTEELETKVEEIVKKRSSKPADVDGRVRRLQEESIKGYEKLGQLSHHLEQVHDGTDELQLAMMKRQKGNKKVESVERSNLGLEQTIEMLQARIKVLEETSYDGTFLWKIPQFSDHLGRAREHAQRVMHSPTFFTSKYGYGLQICLYLNGERIAEGKSVSVYVKCVAGEYDALLRWPLQQTVTFTLKNLTGHEDIVGVFQPDKATALRKPSRLSESTGGCTNFADVRIFDKNSEFIENNTIYLQCSVDLTGLP